MNLTYVLSPRGLMGIALAGALAVVWLAPEGRPLPNHVVSGSNKTVSIESLPSRPTVEDDEAILSRWPDRELDETPAELFVSSSPPKTEVKKVETRANDSLPPFPLRYLGRWSDGGREGAFLTFEGKDYPLAVGESLENMYRLDLVSDELIRVTYLPLGIQQSVAVGEKK